MVDGLRGGRHVQLDIGEAISLSLDDPALPDDRHREPGYVLLPHLRGDIVVHRIGPGGERAEDDEEDEEDEDAEGPAHSGYSLELLHSAPEGRRIDRRVAVELRLDLLEPAPELVAVDQAPGEHLAHVLTVLRVPALDLRERLGVEVVVIEGEAALPRDEGAALLPARDGGDELVRRRELDVDL